jgi:hypothetical protein
MQETQDTTNNVNKFSRKQIFVPTKNPSHNLQSFKQKTFKERDRKYYHLGNCSVQSHNERERERETDTALAEKGFGFGFGFGTIARVYDI